MVYSGRQDVMVESLCADLVMCLVMKCVSNTKSNSLLIIYLCQCGWGEETAKRPSTKPYVESLRNRIKSLETELARYRKKFGNLDDDLSSTVALWHAGSSVPASSHLTLDDTEGTELISASDPDEDIYMPVKLLVVSTDHLLCHGKPFTLKL